MGMELFRKGICAYLEKHKHIFLRFFFWNFLVIAYMGKGICAPLRKGEWNNPSTHLEKLKYYFF